jgi:hypothetical protein
MNYKNIITNFHKNFLWIKENNFCPKNKRIVEMIEEINLYFNVRHAPLLKCLFIIKIEPQSKLKVNVFQEGQS